MGDLISNTVGTVIGGLILTLIIFLLDEIVFSKKNLTGEWKTKMKILKTPHKDYKDTVIEYKIHLIQKGYNISGSGERIKDVQPGGKENVLEPANRLALDVDGYYERGYLRKSFINLNIEEENKRRDTRSTFRLTLIHKKKLKGTFISTAGDSVGTVEMTKNGS
ncbi:MAG TPA: hypothetical protein VK783_11695 [Bacteroidia bacterium]|nr:hypothetical protein [Bacteroidia bacterium]